MALAVLLDPGVAFDDDVLADFGAGSNRTGAGGVTPVAADGETVEDNGGAGTSLRWRLWSNVSMSYRNGLELPLSNAYSTFHPEKIKEIVNFVILVVELKFGNSNHYNLVIEDLRV